MDGDCGGSGFRLQEKIDCDFERLDGYLFAAPGQSSNELNDELKAAHRAGLTDVAFVDRAPIDSFDTGRALRFPRQAQFHPLKYISGLARAIKRDGGRIFTQTHVSKIEGGSSAHVETKDGRTVTAQAVVVATNTPINDLVAIHTKQAAYRSYVLGARVPPGAISRALYWDTADPYHYVRLQRATSNEDRPYDILIIGGEDHKTGQKDDADSRFGRLEAWARERFPAIDAIELRWSGQVMEPVDGLAFIGRNPLDKDNVYIATGDSGMGMTHGTIAGILLCDLIRGRENPWAELYDPSRKTVSAASEFVRENINVAKQYADLLTGGDVRSADDIAPGTGAVIRRGLKDANGALHERSAVCPHLGCVVTWNSLEMTWDCPCHGSRFDAYGKVVNGPAISGLAPSTD